MTDLKLGKLPKPPDERDLHFETYLTPALKTAPVGFGHQGLLQNPWGMLMNDQLGDCEIARQLHSVMLWNATAGKQVQFTDAEAIRVYSAVTGYVPGDPNTDRGTVMRDNLKYAQQKGAVDSDGATHKIGAYVVVPVSTTMLLRALWLCDEVAMGFNVPESAMEQFQAGKPWTVVKGSPIIGGHAIEVVARPNAQGLLAVTWGALQHLSFQFLLAYCDELWGVISTDALTGGKTLEGFDVEQLQADLAGL